MAEHAFLKIELKGVMLKKFLELKQKLGLEHNTEVFRVLLAVTTVENIDCGLKGGGKE